MREQETPYSEASATVFRDEAEKVKEVSGQECWAREMRIRCLVRKRTVVPGEYVTAVGPVHEPYGRSLRS